MVTVAAALPSLRSSDACRTVSCVRHPTEKLGCIFCLRLANAAGAVAITRIAAALTAVAISFSNIILTVPRSLRGL
jgi:hypothetical protein